MSDDQNICPTCGYAGYRAAKNCPFCDNLTDDERRAASGHCGCTSWNTTHTPDCDREAARARRSGGGSE